MEAPLSASSGFLAVSPRQIWRQGSRHERLLIIGGWLLSLLASVGLGLASVIYQWSGLPLAFAGTTIYITLYPPLVICLWWALCFGWWWGAIPAYLATFCLALYAGMPLGWALIFAGANPLGFAVLVIGYRAIAVLRDLRSLNAVMYFVQLAFVGSVFGSAGAMVWTYTNRIDSIGLLPIWQGWWLGAFVQSVLLGAPLLYLTWPALARWQLRRPELLVPEASDQRQRILHMLWVGTAGVLIYGLVSISLGTQRIDAALASADPQALAQAAEVMAGTSWAFYWVNALILVFLAVFIYRLFLRWQHASDALLAQMESLASIDALTGLSNRRVTELRLREQWQRQRRFGELVGILMLDVDHFKVINDTRGHDAGDAALRSLAEQLRSSIRAIDTAGRWGGEEFLVILLGIDATALSEFAERLRLRVASTRIAHAGEEFACTVSIGLTQLDAADMEPEQALKRADQALYAAKQQGRNGSVLATADGRLQALASAARH